jgi:nitrogen fixation NifU-like protein
MMYNEIVHDCFFSPQHSGTLDTGVPLVAYARGTQKNQGVAIDLYMQCSSNGVVIKSVFQTNGNPYIIAALEWLCRQIQGKELEKLAFSYYQALIIELEIPVHQSPIALQVEEVYKEVLYLMRNKLRGQS